ncbi:profilin [Anaeramoeba ignava]|uniref:Profilin n=1 Tax=Anaeramoeba ignava TaxID=1746090 RepID=A0A9Q0RCT3_ANAIG|nr:profilin [Anaeramoeba ignava]
MSNWDSFIEEQLIGSGHISQACILGYSGDILASSKGFKIDSGEITKIINSFEDLPNLLAEGLHINGMKYSVTRAESTIITAKKGPVGAICIKTKQTVLIGLYDETMKSTKSVEIMNELSSYLSTNGY